MGRDKALLNYHGKSQIEWTAERARLVCERVYLSVRPDQTDDPTRGLLPHIVDRVTDKGPIAGIMAAQARKPAVAWLVLACDLPFIDEATLRHLVASRDPARVATAYRSTHDGLPEPLCAIFEPRSRALIEAYVASGKDCPRKFLIQNDALLIDQPNPHALDNINTAAEFEAVVGKMKRPLTPALSPGDGGEGAKSRSLSPGDGAEGARSRSLSPEDGGDGAKSRSLSPGDGAEGAKSRSLSPFRGRGSG
jgi:molybdopterin-guanine dinucleotide biosynthesis protein A